MDLTTTSEESKLIEIKKKSNIQQINTDKDAYIQDVIQEITCEKNQSKQVQSLTELVESQRKTLTSIEKTNKKLTIQMERIHGEVNRKINRHKKQQEKIQEKLHKQIKKRS